MAQTTDFAEAPVMAGQVPTQAAAAVLQRSEPISKDAIPVKGPDFDANLDLEALLASYERIGFQATSFGRAVEIVNKMVRRRIYSLKNDCFINCMLHINVNSTDGGFQTSL